MTHAATPRAAAIRLMVFDVDGVMTDGRLYFSDDGHEWKAFHTLDGQGVKLLQAAGIAVALITGRESGAVTARAKGLGIPHVYQGIRDKHRCLAELIEQLQGSWQETGYMGDDLIDLPPLRACGFSAAPANAHELVRAQADFICAARGGDGAVREVCDFILKAQDRLEHAMATCLGLSSWDSA